MFARSAHRPRSTSPQSSPIPTASPDAQAAAVPLHAPELTIPIGQVGRYALAPGESTLPNGILSAATFDAADPSPTDLVVSPQGVSLGIPSLDGGPAFDDADVHGWHRGTEQVHATLTFEVESFEPGAVLTVTDAEVR